MTVNTREHNPDMIGLWANYLENAHGPAMVFLLPAVAFAPITPYMSPTGTFSIPVKNDNIKAGSFRQRK